MAWFSGKVSLGNFPDLTGAVSKLSESVKNIEKTFDSALGLEGKSDAGASGSEVGYNSQFPTASGLWPSAAERKTLFEPIMGFVGQKGGETVEIYEESKSSKPSSLVSDEQVESGNSTKTEISEQILYHEEEIEKLKGVDVETASEEAIKDAGEVPKHNVAAAERGEEVVSPAAPVDETERKDFESVKPINSLKKEELPEKVSPDSSESGQLESAEKLQQEERPKNISPIELEPVEPESTSTIGKIEVTSPASAVDDSNSLPDSLDKRNTQKDTNELFSPQAPEEPPEGSTGGKETSNSDICDVSGNDKDISADKLPLVQHNDVEPTKAASDLIAPLTDTFAESMELKQQFEEDSDVREQRSSTGSNSSADSVAELEKVKKEMKMMETALQGAARQAQAKADEIAKLMNENEQLKAVIDDLRRKTTEADIESLREEYHQKVAALERKLYTVTKERDTLRREQNKKSDAAALLKEKDEIITQVMAEGEQLSKKQAAQESHIRKLRAQIRELEEEKKGLLTKLQVEENKVDSLKRDKAATEQLLQDTVEKHQAEITTQKEYYTNALNAAKEAEALAEARANTEARTELESRLREVEDRESMLVQTIEELRQTLSRKEQQAVFREDTHRRDIEDLQRLYQASERRCEELITQVPESTRPLLRQIEAMQETATRRAEAWAAVERSLNSRLQEAEAKAATSEEKERSINERLSQTLSRINVLEAQISCLRTEQTQLTRSLEKERQRASENRQEYLALKEEAETHETHANQLENEIRDLRRKHKEELHDMRLHQERLQQELEREKAARLDQEMAIHLQSSAAPDPSPSGRQKSAAFENGNLTRKTSSLSSLPSMEESYFLQSTLDPSESSTEFRTGGEDVMSPYYIKSMTSNTFEAALHQKEGELASYASRLASMESIRDSLAEELVNMTAECEKLRTEAATLPGIRAELEALRRRHSAALELMGERDEELEELCNDIVDLKEMYKEQVNLLVNKIQTLSSSINVAS